MKNLSLCFMCVVLAFSMAFTPFFASAKHNFNRPSEGLGVEDFQLQRVEFSIFEEALDQADCNEGQCEIQIQMASNLLWIGLFLERIILAKSASELEQLTAKYSASIFDEVKDLATALNAFDGSIRHPIPGFFTAQQHIQNRLRNNSLNINGLAVIPEVEGIEGIRTTNTIVDDISIVGVNHNAQSNHMLYQYQEGPGVIRQPHELEIRIQQRLGFKDNRRTPRRLTYYGLSGQPIDALTNRHHDMRGYSTIRITPQGNELLISTTDDVYFGGRLVNIRTELGRPFKINPRQLMSALTKVINPTYAAIMRTAKAVAQKVALPVLIAGAVLGPVFMERLQASEDPNTIILTQDELNTAKEDVRVATEALRDLL